MPQGVARSGSGGAAATRASACQDVLEAGHDLAELVVLLALAKGGANEVAGAEVALACRLADSIEVRQRLNGLGLLACDFLLGLARIGRGGAW